MKPKYNIGDMVYIKDVSEMYPDRVEFENWKWWGSSGIVIEHYINGSGIDVSYVVDAISKDKSETGHVGVSDHQIDTSKVRQMKLNELGIND